MNALEALILDLEHDRSLAAPDRLRRRIDALDRIEAYLLHERDHDRARAMCSRLEAINDEFYQTARSEIRQGKTPAWLLEQAIDWEQAHEEAYDYLDVAMSGILQFEEPDTDIAELADDMVFYQPTPARHIFDLIRRAGLTERDVLVDLGSGLGHVPLLTSICTRARSIGIEREAVYVDCARRSAATLNLSNATFIQQDARDADFSFGTVFYLYTPFTGAILRTVLDALRREAIGRDIRLATYGPCTAIVAEEPWLDVVGPLEPGRLALFRSHNGNA